MHPQHLGPSPFSVHSLITERLIVWPLGYSQLLVYLRGGNELERSLGLATTGRSVAPAVKANMEKTLLPPLENALPEQFFFYTVWVVINKLSKTIVAELGFKGLPDKNKAVEIEYGTMPAHTGNGYMTEAVEGMLKWAAARQDIDFVLASIDPTNSASVRIVQKNHFELFDRRGGIGWWRKDLRN